MGADREHGTGPQAVADAAGMQGAGDLGPKGVGDLGFQGVDGGRVQAADTAWPQGAGEARAQGADGAGAPGAAGAELEEMRRRVRARRDEEEAAAGGPGDAGAGAREIPPDFVMQCVRAEDLGLGMLYAEIHRGRFLFVKQSREWLQWSGHHWALDGLDVPQAEVEAVADRLLEEHSRLGRRATEAAQAGDKDLAKLCAAQQQMILARVKRLRKEGGPDACLRFAHTNRAPLAITGDELDAQEWLLACANGVLDLRTGRFRGGRPEDYLLKASPVEWRGIDAPAPRWERFLSEIMSGDGEMVAYLGRVFGAAMRGGSKEHVLPVLHGKGRNGKSLLVDTVSEVLGPLAGPIPAEMLLDQNNVRNADAPSPSIMALRGMRAAFASETDEGRRFSAARCKWLSGGDRLTGRWPNDKRPVTFAPTHILFLLTNHKPHAPADDFAFWERLHLIPFERSFVDREPQDAGEMRRDDGLGAALRAEASGILAWLVRGCLDWQAQGLAPPPKVLAATQDYRRDEDLLALFVEDCCEVVPCDLADPAARTNATELYDAFVRWFARNISRKKQFPQRKFGALAQKKFEKAKVGGKNWYYGVRLNAETREELGDDRLF